MPVTCAYCGSKVEKTPKAIRSHQKLKRENFFCNQKCLHDWQSGAFAKARAPKRERKARGLFCVKCKENKRLHNHRYCKQCLYKYQMQRWIKRKIAAVVYLGGKCVRCGRGEHYLIFDFHHRDRGDKEFDWCKLRKRRWEDILKELDKCDLLCVICHRLTHAIFEMTITKEEVIALGLWPQTAVEPTGGLC